MILFSCYTKLRNFHFQIFSLMGDNSVSLLLKFLVGVQSITGESTPNRDTESYASHYEGQGKVWETSARIKWNRGGEISRRKVSHQQKEK